jgi:membrane fusion protein (multidrug efflux system)
MLLLGNTASNPVQESVMRSAPVLAPLSAALFSVVLAACSPSNGSEKKGGHPGMGMPPPEVSAVTVTAQSLPLSFEYVGQSAGSREVEVRARVPGVILKRNFTEGAPVKEGQSLYTIDPAQLDAAAARAEADVVAAQARLEQAKRNAARLKPLYAEKAVSQKENDDAVSAEEISAADVKAARARLTEAKLNLSYTKVESPVSGVASRSLRSEGSLVGGPETLLTTVVQVDPIWVNFGIPDNEQAQLARDVQAGRVVLPKGGTFEVALKLADGSMYEHTGKLNFSDVRVSPTTGTREARAEVPNPKGVLRPGEFVRVILRGALRPNAVTVPQRAVLEGPQGKFVYIVDENNTAQPRPIEVGDWAGDAWIINKGVQPGDRVIVEGLMRLGPGAPVRLAEAGAKPAAQPQGKPPANKK